MLSTNITQSKRLLEAGLDQKTADMRWEDFPGCVPHLCYQPNSTSLIAPKVTPAWSLSALWDIMLRSGVAYEYSTCESSKDVLDSLVAAVARLAKQGRIK